MRHLCLIAIVVTFIAGSAYHAWSASVDGYYRRDGTYVQPHWRTNPDHNPWNNYSYPGNTNPYTGRTTPDTHSPTWDLTPRYPTPYNPYTPYGR